MTDEALAGRTSPQLLARVGGVLYLIIIVGGAFGEAYIRGGRVVSGDATATAENILASETLWRVGIANEFFMLMCTVALALILYVLLRPVSRDLALLAVLFNLVSIAVEAVNEQNLLGALLPLSGAEFLRAFDPEQLHALSYLRMQAYEYGFGVSLLFFGCECLVLGVLIYRSGYLPKTIGILMLVAGVTYLVNMFAVIVAPPVAAFLFPVGMLPVLLGECSLCLWLLLKGVNESKWRARASAA